ncbi:MAG TPA: GAF domain-containing protein, partial [Longimicrobiales bacterium]|nr:GAF domain-containing protein [Longimicrobiales bacterium]
MPDIAVDFRLIVENIREIVWIYDVATLRVLYVNPSYERILGRNVDELYVDPGSWQLAVDERDRARVSEELARSAANNDSPNVEFRVRRSDDEVRWLWLRGSSVLDLDGRRIAIGVAEDVTQRRETEIALQTSLSLLRATFDATADGILAVDMEGRITTFNRRFVELWRIPDFIAIEAGQETELRRHMAKQLKNPETLMAGLHESLRMQPTDSFDVLEFLDGRVFEMYSRPQWLGEELSGRVWSFRDVAARAHAERELRERSRRVSIQNEMLFHLARQRISDRVDLDSAIARIAEAAAAMMRTERVGVWFFNDERTRIELHDVFERSRESHSAGTLLDVESVPSYMAALDEERALAINDVYTDPRTAELAESYCAPLGISSMLDAPIRTGGYMIGIVCFEHVGPRRSWTVEEASFAGSIADLVSIAIEGADRQRAEHRLGFLAESSAILASSLDYQTTIQQVIDLAVPQIADGCTVDVVEDGTVRRIASSHADRERPQRLVALDRENQANTDSPAPWNRVIRTGKAELWRNVTPEALRETGMVESEVEALADLGITSLIAAPMTTRDRIIGAVTFFSVDRAFDDDDLALASDLAARAAAAVDQSLRYRNAQDANRAKSSFLAVMSHELRTPLTAIMGYADLLGNEVSGPLNPAQRDQLMRISRRAEDLLRIVEEIIAYSRTEIGTEKPRLEELDLAELIDDVAESMRPMIEERGLEFRVEKPQDQVTIRTDPSRLRHVLLDLLSNALKFTEEGWVRLSAGVEDGRLKIAVQDTGRGVAP